jgi:hypothetical protein
VCLLLGDIVRIVPCRPMSRKKRHVLMDIIVVNKKAAMKEEEQEGDVLSHSNFNAVKTNKTKAVNV